MLRTIAGFVAERFRLLGRPPLVEPILLPQRPYMVTGTLRGQTPVRTRDDVSGVRWGRKRCAPEVAVRSSCHCLAATNRAEIHQFRVWNVIEDRARTR